MSLASRRQFLKCCAAAALAAPALGAKPEQVPSTVPASGPTTVADAYATLFYQYRQGALEKLSAPDGLPNGPGYVHVFAQSYGGARPNRTAARNVHACGASFRYAPCFDLHRYQGWTSAADAQLRDWATAFRAGAFAGDEPPDFFALNAMPESAPERPDMRGVVAKLCRYLHDAGDGLPPLRGVLYLTEPNVLAAEWLGPRAEDEAFWRAIDDTCDLVAGVHYHHFDDVVRQPPEQYARQVLFPLATRLARSEAPAQANVARSKYCAVHSSYYGPHVTRWAGLRNDRQTLEDGTRYLEHVIAATRSSPYGRRRIGFSPLSVRQYDGRFVDVLADVLGREARAVKG